MVGDNRVYTLPPLFRMAYRLPVVADFVARATQCFEVSQVVGRPAVGQRVAMVDGEPVPMTPHTLPPVTLKYRAARPMPCR